MVSTLGICTCRASCQTFQIHVVHVQLGVQDREVSSPAPKSPDAGTLVKLPDPVPESLKPTNFPTLPRSSLILGPSSAGMTTTRTCQPVFRVPNSEIHDGLNWGLWASLGLEPDAMEVSARAVGQSQQLPCQGTSCSCLLRTRGALSQQCTSIDFPLTET